MKTVTGASSKRSAALLGGAATGAVGTAIWWNVCQRLDHPAAGAIAAFVANFVAHQFGYVLAGYIQPRVNRWWHSMLIVLGFLALAVALGSVSGVIPESWDRSRIVGNFLAVLFVVTIGPRDDEPDTVPAKPL